MATPNYVCTHNAKRGQNPHRGPWCYQNSSAANKNGIHFHLPGLGKRIHEALIHLQPYADMQKILMDTDICEVASSRNQINHRSQRAICLIMSSTSHFLSTQTALCEWADGIAMGWHCPPQLQMQSIYTACWKNDTTQAASWEKRFKLNKCHQTKYTHLLMFWTYLIQPLSSNQIHARRPGSDAI